MKHASFCMPILAGAERLSEDSRFALQGPDHHCCFSELPSAESLGSCESSSWRSCAWAYGEGYCTWRVSWCLRRSPSLAVSRRTARILFRQSWCGLRFRALDRASATPFAKHIVFGFAVVLPLTPCAHSCSRLIPPLLGVRSSRLVLCVHSASPNRDCLGPEHMLFVKCAFGPSQP